MKQKIFKSPSPIYSKEANNRKSKIILHGTEKTSRNVKGRHARPKFIPHICKNETNCELCKLFILQTLVYHSRRS